MASKANKAELLAYRDMPITIRDKVAKLKQQSRSLDETIAAKPQRRSTPSGVNSSSPRPSSPDWFTRASDALRIVTQRRRLRPFARKDGRL